MHLKCNILDDHIQETDKRLSSASDLKASAGCRTLHSETQNEDGDEGNCFLFFTPLFHLEYLNMLSIPQTSAQKNIWTQLNPQRNGAIAVLSLRLRKLKGFVFA